MSRLRGFAVGDVVVAIEVDFLGRETKRHSMRGTVTKLLPLRRRAARVGGLRDAVRVRWESGSEARHDCLFLAHAAEEQGS